MFGRTYRHVSLSSLWLFCSERIRFRHRDECSGGAVPVALFWVHGPIRDDMGCTVCWFVGFEGTCTVIVSLFGSGGSYGFHEWL